MSVRGSHISQSCVELKIDGRKIRKTSRLNWQTRLNALRDSSYIQYNSHLRALFEDPLHSNITRFVTSVVTRVYHCNELQGRYKVVTIELNVVMVNSLQPCNDFL